MYDTDNLVGKILLGFSVHKIAISQVLRCLSYFIVYISSSRLYK